MDCRLSTASRLEVLLDEDKFRSSVQTLELGDILLPSLLCVTVLVLYSFLCCVLLFDPPSRVSTYLFNFFSDVWVSKKQLLVDSCPDLGLPVLIGSVAIKLGTFQGFFTQFCNMYVSVTCLPVFDNLVLGFTLIRWMSLLLQQYQNPNRTSNYLS